MNNHYASGFNLVIKLARIGADENGEGGVSLPVAGAAWAGGFGGGILGDALMDDRIDNVYRRSGPEFKDAVTDLNNAVARYGPNHEGIGLRIARDGVSDALENIPANKARLWKNQGKARAGALVGGGLLGIGLLGGGAHLIEKGLTDE